MGGQSGNAQAANAGAVNSAMAQTGLAKGFANTNQNLTNTLFGTTGGGTGTGTLSKMMDPNSLNVSAPTGPYALQYSQAKANNAIGTDQASQAINREAQQHGFGSSSPSGYTGYLQSQNTQAGNTNAGNLFSQYAGQSYQDALNNFWKATQMAGTAASQTGQAALTGNQDASNTYTQLYSASPKTSFGTNLANAAAGAAGKAVGGKA